MYTASAVSLACLTALCSVVFSQTGIKQVTDLNGKACSDVLTYLCTTTGLGETVVNISGINVEFDFRHSTYKNSATGPNQELNETALNGQLKVGNLSESDNKTCFDQVLNQSDFCYTTTLVTPVNDETKCQRIRCSVFNNGATIPFGDALVENIPPLPSNITIVNRSADSVTVVWTPNITDCPGALYEVSTTNCGSCDSMITTITSRITCDSLAADKVCVVSIRSMSECGSYSEPVMKPVEPLPVTTNDETDRNVHIGVQVGAPIVVLVILVTAVVIVIIFYIYRRKNRFSPKPPKASSLKPAATDPVEAETALSTTGSHDDSHAQIEDPGTQRLIQPTNSAYNPPTTSVPDLHMDSEENGGQFTDDVTVVLPTEAESAGENNASTMIVQPHSIVNKSPVLPSHPHVAVETEADSTPYTHRGLESTPMIPDVQPFVARTGSRPNDNIEDIAAEHETRESDSGPAAGDKPPPNYSISEGGRPLTQEHTVNGTEEEVKKKVVISSPKNESGLSQVVALNRIGTRTYKDPATPNPDIEEKVDDHEERLKRLEQYRVEDRTKIDELNDEVSRLSRELKKVTVERDELQKKCATLSQNCEQYQKCMEDFTKKIEYLEKTLAEKERELEEERKAPKKSISNDPNNLDSSRPELLRAKSCPEPPNM